MTPTGIDCTAARTLGPDILDISGRAGAHQRAALPTNCIVDRMETNLWPPPAFGGVASVLRSIVRRCSTRARNTLVAVCRCALHPAKSDLSHLTATHVFVRAILHENQPAILEPQMFFIKGHKVPRSEGWGAAEFAYCWSPHMPRILLVDSHGVYRKGLRLALQVHFPGSQIIEADDLEAARRELDPDGILDLVLVDVDAPDASLDVLRALRQSHPRTRLVALSGIATRNSILHSLESYLFGFISKSQPDNEIFSAIKDILSGRIYVPVMLTQAQAANGSADRASNLNTGSSSADAQLHPEKLTPRQREILPLLAKGMSNKEIARALKIAEGTTKIHASGLLRVLGVRNRTEAAVAAREYVLQEEPPAVVPRLRTAPRPR